MNIVLGKENAEVLAEKFIVLELDTFKNSTGQIITAFCTVENIPLNEIHESAIIIEMHNSMIDAYKTKNWKLCKDLLKKIYGKFGGEVDTYYETIQTRVNDYIINDPGNDWNGIIDMSS